MTALSMSSREFERFQELVYDETGIFLPPTKQVLVVNRLTKRVRALGLDNFDAYYDAVTTGSADEFVHMLDAITTNETRFFREPAHFQLLADTIIPEWLAEAARGQRRREVRVWSAGCSTGEEAYSLGMTLLAHLRGERWQIEIVASDLSTKALHQAVEGVWPIERAAEIPEEHLKAFMLRGHGPEEGKMRAGNGVRSVITFERRNLNSDLGNVGSFDAIFCRNVMIYFDPSSRARTLARLVDRCDMGGYLFVGHAETLAPLAGSVNMVKPTVCRRIT